MRANEAPEKLYIDLFKGEFNVSYSPINNSVEYTRTDTLIKKIKEWLNKHAEDNNYTWYDETEHTSGITDKFIEDFLNYIKE